MARCIRCHAPIEIRAERHRVRLSRSWYEGKAEEWGDAIRFRYVEKSKGLISGTLCEVCAGVVGDAIEEAIGGKR